MEFGFLPDDVVLFELPTIDDAEVFAVELRSSWPGWSEADDYGWLFTVELGEEPEDLTDLLSRAQELVAELGLPAIRFHLDGRAYVLRAPALSTSVL